MRRCHEGAGPGATGMERRGDRRQEHGDGSRSRRTTCALTEVRYRTVRPLGSAPNVPVTFGFLFFGGQNARPPGDACDRMGRASLRIQPSSFRAWASRLFRTSWISRMPESHTQAIPTEITTVLPMTRALISIVRPCPPHECLSQGTASRQITAMGGDLWGSVTALADGRDNPCRQSRYYPFRQPHYTPRK